MVKWSMRHVWPFLALKSRAFFVKSLGQSSRERQLGGVWQVPIPEDVLILWEKTSQCCLGFNYVVPISEHFCSS